MADWTHNAKAMMQEAMTCFLKVENWELKTDFMVSSSFLSYEN